MFKKALALIMTVVMLMSFMALTASSAAKTPTRLYVGEKNKTEDNLIAMYKKEKAPIIVHSVNNATAYYQLSYDDDAGEYILTLYNYVYSEPVQYGNGAYGIYCDGDIRIVLDGTSAFNLNRHPDKEVPVTDAIGICVKGTLTITSNGKSAGLLSVSGDLRKSSDSTNSIGIYAENLLINDVIVTANGGYSGAYVKGTLAVVDAKFFANTTASLYSDVIDPATGKGAPLFEYGVAANILVQGAAADSADKTVVQVGGDVDINSYVLEDNVNDRISDFVAEFDVDVVGYLKSFAILNEVRDKTYKTGKEIKVIDKDLPDCFGLASSDTDYMTTSGKNIKIVDGEKTVTLGIILECGNATLCFDSTNIGCERTFLQKVIDFFTYYILFGWLIEKINAPAAA